VTVTKGYTNRTLMPYVATSSKRKRVPENPYGRSIKRKSMLSRDGALSVNRIPRTLREFPKEMRVRLKYSYAADFTVTSSATPNFVVFRANSVFDPEAAIGGGTPTGFAEWSNFYRVYTVVKSSCKMRLLDKDIGTSSTGPFSCLMGICMKDTSTPIPSWTQAALITDTDSTYMAASSYSPNNRVVKNFNSASYFGVKDVLDNNELSGNCGAITGGNPGKQSYFACWANQAITGSSASQICVMEVLVEYDVIFREPVDVVA